MKTRKGLTLLEVVLTLALIGMIITTGTSLIVFAKNAHIKTADEFDLQANTRLMSQKINITIRDSAATFLLHRDDENRENTNTFTEGWNYILLSNDNTRLYEYNWDESTSSFKKRELITALDGVTFDLEYIKNNAAHVDKLLEYVITINFNGKTRTIKSEVEGLNSLQIVDRSYDKVANTLAYRYDTRLSEVSNSQAVVSMVLDQSGSMSNKMNGGSANDGSSNTNNHSRMKKLKAEATRFVNEMAKYPNIYISINPFSSTGNNSKPMLKAQVNNTANNDLLSYINGLRADGGTNTGDGIRRGYHRIAEFNETEENKNKTNKNFMIILVDGVTTFSTVKKINEIEYDYYQGDKRTVDGKDYYYYDASYGWFDDDYYYAYVNESDFITGNANINNRQVYGSINYTEGGYFGRGNDLDPWGTEYVNIIGEMVREYKKGTNEAIKVYIIGFSSVSSDLNSLRDIALATTGDTVYYTAGDQEALEEIFRSIEKDISDALWHIGGPN